MNDSIVASDTGTMISCRGCDYCYTDYFCGQIYRECTLAKMYSPNLGMYELSPNWCLLKGGDQDCQKQHS